MDHEVISWGQPVLFLRNCSPGPNRTQGLRLRWVVAWRANLHGGLLSCSKVMLLTLDPSMFWTDDSWLSMPWLYFTFGSERTMFISATSAIFNPRSTGRVVAGLVVTVLLYSPMELQKEQMSYLHNQWATPNWDAWLWSIQLKILPRLSACLQTQMAGKHKDCFISCYVWSVSIDAVNIQNLYKFISMYRTQQ